MKNQIMFNIKGIGELYFDQLFFEYETQPIVFTCLDNRKKVYLALCNDIYDKPSWIITRVNLDILCDLICNTRSVYDAFRDSEHEIIFYTEIGKECQYNILSFSEIDKDELPDKTEFLDLSFEERLLFKSYFSNMEEDDYESK